MPNTIQNISNNSQTQNYYITPPAQNTQQKQPPQPTKQTQNENYYNNKTIIASLSGLAVLGGSIWALATGKFKSKVKPMVMSAEEINLNINNLTEQIKNLKKLIKNDYLAKKQAIINKINNSDEFNTIHIEDEKTIRQKITTLKTEYRQVTKTSSQIIAENKQIIKERFKTLVQNPEFNELRKLRKALIKTATTSNSEDEVKIANEKITMINDLLINRVYPDEAAKYKLLHNIDDEQVFGLVKENFESYEQFVNKYDSLKGQEMDFDFSCLDNKFRHKESLHFKDIFPKEADIINTNTQLIEDARLNLFAIENLYNTYKAKLTNLATQYRQTEAVKELTSLIQQLKMLRARLKTAA